MIAADAQPIQTPARTQDAANARRRALGYLRYRTLNSLALGAGDGIALLSAILLATLFRDWLIGGMHAWYWLLMVVPGWWGGALVMRLLPSWGLGPVEELRRATILILIVFAATTAVLFVSKEAAEVSRLALLFALALSSVFVPLVRLHVKRLLIRNNIWGIPTAIYGSPDAAARILEFLELEKGLGYRPVAVFNSNDVGLNRSMSLVMSGAAAEGPGDAVVAILANSGLTPERTHELMDGSLAFYRTVLLIPDLPDAPSLWVSTRDLNGVLGLEIEHNIASPVQKFVKRAVDLTLVLAFAPLWIPVCCLLAFIIWREDGDSPFFVQERLGRDGRAFLAIKFRTMVPNAEQVLKEYLRRDEAMRAEWEVSYKLRRDPRITTAGHFLRRFSLDELPQLVNVLFGHMSLVGPRPLPSYHHIQLTQRARHLRERVRPGLTGFWQVSGRSDIGTSGMERWDSYYVRNWSPWLDTVVLIRTFRIVIEGRGAY